MTLQELIDLLNAYHAKSDSMPGVGVIRMLEQGGRNTFAAVDPDGEVFLYRGRPRFFLDTEEESPIEEWIAGDEVDSKTLAYVGNIGSRHDWRDLIIEVE